MKASLVLVALACVPSLLWADSLRCGNRIISTGSGIAEVAALCGDPTHVDRSSAYRRYAGRVAPGFVEESAVEIAIEIWTYIFGPDKLMERIRFENGIVVQMDSLGYGYNE